MDRARRLIVPLFLYSQAIELALKAFLLLNKVPKTQLKQKYGHNLVKLAQKARALGLDSIVPLNGGEIDTIKAANDHYDSAGGKRLQYFDIELVMRGYKGLPDRAALGSLAGKLLDEGTFKERYLEA